jgi:hypothetical protein
MPDDAGERAHEAEALVRLGPDLVPVGVIRHAQRPMAWMVWGTLESWRAPAREDLRGQHDVTQWHRLRVSGPLPWQPEEYGEFILTVRRYGDTRGRWWITPDPEAPATGSP